jgi:hypothetical protein
MKKTKRIASKFLFIVIVSSIVAGIYLIYFFTIGVPKTQARNFYNLALEKEKEGNIEQTIEYLKLAKNAWSETYIDQKIEELTSQK